MGCERAVPRPHYDDALARDLDEDVVTGGRQRLFAAGTEPLPAEDALLFPGKDLLREVELPAEGALHQPSPPSGP